MGRFIAIMAIITLGVGFFAGLKVTDSAMRASMLKYLTNREFYDFRMVSTLGFEEEDIDYIREQLPEARAVEGTVSFDIIAEVGDNTDNVKFLSIPESVNTIELVSGRLPEADNECVVDSYTYSEDSVGRTVTILDTNDSEDREHFVYREYTIVGTCKSPLYVQYERGNTTLGNGVLNGFAYINKGGFDCEYDTDCYIRLDSDLPLYSDEYKDLINSTEDRMQEIVDTAAQNRYNRIVEEAQEELDDARASLEEEKEKGQQELNDAKASLDEAKKSIDEYSDMKTQLQSGLQELGLQIAAMEEAMAVYPEAVDQTAYQYALTQKQSCESQLDTLTKALEDAECQYEDGLAEYEDGLAEFESRIADAEDEIADGEAEIADIEKPTTYLLDRTSNAGYVCFESDSGIVGAIADVFPIFFFLVAALVCMTTMSRMVEDQRTQIGVLKALGYGNTRIAGKYAFYSGSSALVGCVIGYASGTVVFPQAIWFAYQMMYNAGRIDYLFDWKLLVISILVALLCSVGITLAACRMELIQMAASLMRPKAPKAGKRILLEHIPFIWNRMKFLRKVSLRNIFRYKGRLIMMVLGIGGCTALLVAGFGIYDSIADIAKSQYHNVSLYDADVILKNAVTDSESDVLSKLGYAKEDYILFYQTNADISTDVKTKNLYINVFDDETDLEGFYDMHTEDGDKLSLPGFGETVMNAGIAKLLGVKVGDTITISSESIQEYTVKIVGLNENFIYDYIYINSSTYQDMTGKLPQKKNIYLNMDPEKDVHEESAVLLGDSGIVSVMLSVDMLDRVDNMMKSMNIIIYIVIGCAVALAFVVVYNLTNINISERVREIATVKVLGFQKKEYRSYVFRENIVMAVMGAAVGLLMGKWLHSFIMSKIVIDLITFDVRITLQSYLYSFALTILFTYGIDVLMRGKLDSISMTESLKAVE